MTTDTLLTKAATLRKQFSALITDCVFKARTPAETQRSEPTYPAAFDELMLACFKAGQLREREAKAEGLDAAFRKGLEAGAQCCEAAHRTSAYGDAAEPLEIARYIRKQADELSRQYAAILATKPGDGESRG